MTENCFPEVSIIIPVYNTAEYLPGLLDSIRTQTYTAFEAVLIDDGSTDGSGQICDVYAKTDARFVVVHRENKGVSSARNTGIQASHGQYLFFADSDDILHPAYLETGIKELENGYDLVSLNRTELYTDGTAKHFSRERKEYRIKDKGSRLELVLDMMLKSSFSWEVWTLGVRRSLIEQYSIAFDEETDYAEDLCFSLYCAAHASSAVMVPDELYTHRIHEQSLSAPYAQQPAFGLMSRLSERTYNDLCRYEDCRILTDNWPMIHYAFLYKELQKVRTILRTKPWTPLEEFHIPDDEFLKENLMGMEGHMDTMAQYADRTVLKKDLATIGFLYHGKRGSLLLSGLINRR